MGECSVLHVHNTLLGLVSDSDDSNGDAEEEEQQQEQEREAAMEVDGEGSEVAAPPHVVGEEQGNNQFEEDEDVSEEDSHSIYEGDDEDGGEESGEGDREFDGAGAAHSRAPSNAVPAGSAQSGGNSTRTFKKRIFEGICLLQQPDKTAGEVGGGGAAAAAGVARATVIERRLQYGGPSERRRRRKNRRRKKKEAGTSSDEYQLKKRKYRRLKKGPSNRQGARDGGKAYDGQYGGQNGGERGMNNVQDDLSFKQRANLAKMRKHQASRAKAAYDELLNAMFAEWENYTKASVPGDGQNENALPLTFSFGDEDADAKSDDDRFQEELWWEFDAALECNNVGSHECEEDDTCNGQKVLPEEAFSCKNGRHEFIIDEQIGVRCKHCNVVDLEIRYVLPSMGKFATERDTTTGPELDLFKEMLTFFEKNDLLVSNGNEGAFRIGAHKAGSVWDLIPGVKEDMFLHQQDAFEFVWRKLAGSIEIEEIQEFRRTANTDIGGGCVISHAPGTGKTRLAITFVQSYLELFPQCCPVIIAPRAMLATWEQEFKKWKVKLPFHVLNSTEINCSDDKTIQAKIEKRWKKLANDDGMDGDNVRKLLLERPDLLVLDEGHTPRNKKSLIWKVLSQVRTEKRIILSGTLFQNNFEELYNTLYLVRPKDAMLLEKDEGKDWTSLRLSNITEENIDNVRAKLEPVVHYHKGNFLEKSLPGLTETVVILNPLPLQKEIITSMEKIAAIGTLDAEYKISLALVHPSLITCAKLSGKEACLVDHTMLKSLRSNPCEGVKTRFVVEVINQCQALNERVLVFSQYLDPLSLIMEQLKTKFNWTEDKEILQMSGNVRVKQREAMMAAFNNMKSEAKVMLASTKACCEGITLIGASRVVLLDVVWNPSVGRQAIGRAYRFGQKKIVYTYNLIADGTKEMEKYSRQAKKEYMSKMLFSNEEQPEGGNISPESTFNDRVLEAMTAREDLKDLFVEIRIENQTDGSIRILVGRSSFYQDVVETEQENANPII
ncbi:hypothetical protein PR202_ga02159 [Eleusine coracana subsp. coracana]|uniref:Uncharacterized protein n=1 Tax=Eleusine coracana subsp. coracana TaxID=191504 RepID=A0AAV5BJ36_ELECO|nr:hypothetical protein PR202_ga02159 [Eleusine coracana subsp. coracana]